MRVVIPLGFTALLLCATSVLAQRATFHEYTLGSRLSPSVKVECNQDFYEPRFKICALVRDIRATVVDGEVEKIDNATLLLWDDSLVEISGSYFFTSPRKRLADVVAAVVQSNPNAKVVRQSNAVAEIDVEGDKVKLKSFGADRTFFSFSISDPAAVHAVNERLQLREAARARTFESMLRARLPRSRSRDFEPGTCPSNVICPPSYGAIFTPIERICSGQLSEDDVRVIADMLRNGEIQTQDLLYLTNAFAALYRHQFVKLQSLNAFFYAENRASWLPPACLTAIGAWSSPDAVPPQRFQFRAALKNLRSSPGGSP